MTVSKCIATYIHTNKYIVLYSLSLKYVHVFLNIYLCSNSVPFYSYTTKAVKDISKEIKDCNNKLRIGLIVVGYSQFQNLNLWRYESLVVYIWWFLLGAMAIDKLAPFENRGWAMRAFFFFYVRQWIESLSNL